MEIQQIVVGKLLSFTLWMKRASCPGSRIECGRLVGVLAVAQPTHSLEHLDVDRWQRLLALRGAARQIGGDRGIVAGGPGEGLERPAATLRPRGATLAQGRQHLGIARRMLDDDHVGEVLGSGAQQGHPTDVDLLDRPRFVERSGPLLERIQGDGHQIDGLDAALGQRPEIVRLIAARQDRPMNVRMERLHATTEQLRESGPRLDRRHRHSGALEMAGRPTRGENARVALGKRAGELDRAALVRQREQRGARPPHGRRRGPGRPGVRPSRPQRVIRRSFIAPLR